MRDLGGKAEVQDTTVQKPQHLPIPPFSETTEHYCAKKVGRMDSGQADPETGQEGGTGSFRVAGCAAHERPTLQLQVQSCHLMVTKAMWKEGGALGKQSFGKQH